MFSRIKLLFLLIAVTDLILLGVMIHYTSWLFMLGFVFLSALIGGWVLNNYLHRYFKKTFRLSDLEGTSGEDILLGAAARLAAGVLFIVPGILTDLIALALISPAGKWLMRIVAPLPFGKMFSRHSKKINSSLFTDETPAKDEIIDVRIVNASEEELENER